MPDTSANDIRQSLIVLPFEDLSPIDEENEWFADGLAGEMIDALAHVKSLRVLDRNTSRSLRTTKLRMVEIGKEFTTRYFIEGSVRKVGEQINIVVSLLDIETGEHLWRDYYHGEFKDIFDIQEALAEKVVSGLKLHLSLEEKTLLQKHGTENAEAYQFFIRAQEYSRLQTKEGSDIAIQLFTDAIKLDPAYAEAYAYKANMLAAIYFRYDSDPHLLQQGLDLIAKAFELRPDLWEAYQSLSVIYRLQGKLDSAESAAREWIKQEPENGRSHFALATFFYECDQSAKAIPHDETAVGLMPDNISAVWNLVLSCNEAEEMEKRQKWSEVALPLFERHLKLFPEDENKRVGRAILLFYAGRTKKAIEATREFGDIRDGTTLYNGACLQAMLQDYTEALRTLRRAIEAGFRNLLYLKDFVAEYGEAFGKLEGASDYQAMKDLIAQLETRERATATTKE